MQKYVDMYKYFTRKHNILNLNTYMNCFFIQIKYIKRLANDINIIRRRKYAHL